MDLGLKGKKALVTGSSSGIGHSIARALVTEGVHTVLCGKSDRVFAAAEALQAAGVLDTRVIPVQVDLADAKGVSDLLERTVDSVGVPDLLVNNAGREPFGSIDDFDETEWRNGFDLKLWGYVKLTKAILDQMRNARVKGSIVSISGSIGTYPQPWYVAGAMINSALNAFTAAVAHHVAADGIRVNVVSPHLIDTPRVDRFTVPPRGVPNAAELLESVGLRRKGRPEEVANVVLFLLSDRASFLSGAVVPVDGATIGLLQAGHHEWSSA